MARVLIIADQLNNDPHAIKKGVDTARALNADLDVVSFCYAEINEQTQHAVHSNDNIERMIINRVEKDAKRILSELVPDDMVYFHQTIWHKNIHDWIIDYTEKETPLMVIKTGNRTETMLYTPTDWHLMRDCSVPVMISASEPWHDHSTLLATVDLSNQDDSNNVLNHVVLKHASELGQKTDTVVNVAYVIPVSPVLHDLGLVDTQKVLVETQAKLAERIETLSAQYGIPVKNWHVKVGQTEKVLTSLAADLHTGVVVIGTAGRKGLKGRVIGNTAEKILQLIKADVLAVRIP